MYELVDVVASCIVAVAGVPVAPPSEVVPPAESVAIESVWDFVKKGGPMMVPIGICSLVVLAVVVERLITLRSKRVMPPTFRKELDTKLEAGDTSGAIALCDRDGSALSTVLGAGVRRLGDAVDVVERRVAHEGEHAILGLRKRLRVLSVIAAVAPLMGLVGTIFGMIRSFQTVATSGEALGRTELLAEGIYEAMVTTAAGLLVAIPALICYHWISGRLERIVAAMDRVTVDFVERFVRPAASATPRQEPEHVNGSSSNNNVALVATAEDG